MNMDWVVYILQCSDGSLYTGITNNLARRIERHGSGKGAKYTRGRRPLKCVFFCHCSTKSEALRYEHNIKKTKRANKLKMIEACHHRCR
jgi:putative endonuclease